MTFSLRERKRPLFCSPFSPFIVGRCFYAVELAKRYKGKPTVIIAHTVKGKGISFMENNPSWHHRVPSDEEYHHALVELEAQNDSE